MLVYDGDDEIIVPEANGPCVSQKILKFIMQIRQSDAF